MNPVLVFDVETTGLPLFEQPSEHPDQPHLVQLAALLIDLDTRKELSTLDLIIRPDGWVIPEEVSRVHGITHEMAMDLGVPEDVAVDALLGMWAGGRRTRIAHNEQFDARIIRIALKRYHDPVDTEATTPPSDVWKAGPAECTARLATPVMKLPPTQRMRAAGRHHFKTPNLGEAYLHFTGRPLDGAHNAMVDVRACAAVYFAIKQPEAVSA